MMKISTIDWSFGEFKIPSTLYRHADSKGLLVVFPGGGYSAFGPALYYPTNLYLDKMYDVLSLEYDFKRFVYEGDKDIFLKDLGAFLFQRISSEFENEEIHLIAKSIGTRIIAQSYDSLAVNFKARIRKIVLLTPVWNQPEILQKLLEVGPKTFHVIGTADKLYDAKVEKTLLEKGIGYLVIPNADHGLDIEGDVKKSILELGNMVEKIEIFIKTH